MEEIILSHGYIKKGFGFVKITENITHWITKFEGSSIQMYSYYTDDKEFDKVYDTGILNMICSSELDALIIVLTKNHK